MGICKLKKVKKKIYYLHFFFIHCRHLHAHWTINMSTRRFTFGNRRVIHKKGMTMEQARSFQKKAFETAEKTPIKRFDTDGFDLTVQFITSFRKDERSKNQKCLFLMGNLSNVYLTEKAKKFVTQTDVGLDIMPQYQSGTDKKWPKLEAMHPLSSEDSIHLTSFGVFTIHVSPSLAKNLNPMDFVTLVDIQYAMFLPRKGLPEGVKISDLTADQLEWKESDLYLTDPVFYFKANHFKALPRVSYPALMSMYDATSILNRKVEKFIPYYSRGLEEPPTYAEGPTGHIGEESKKISTESDNVIFHNQYGYTHMSQRVDFIPFDASFSLGDEASVVFSRDGTRGYEFYLIVTPDNLISDRQKNDRMKFESIKSLKEKDKTVKAWSFLTTGRQVEYARPSVETLKREGLTEADFEETGGLDLRNPILDQFFTAKINMYENTIERVFGIYDKTAWIRFISVYNGLFAGVFQCKIDSDKTMSREADLEVVNNSRGPMGRGEQMYEFALHYRCDGILYDMQEWVQRIGVPVSKDVANDLIYLMEHKREGNGSTKDIRNLPTYSSHSVACLNEIEGIETCKNYVNHEDAQVFMVMMPPKLNKARFKLIEDIQTIEVGDQLAKVSVLKSETYDETTHNKRISKLWEYFNDEEEDTLFPLLFIVCKPRDDLYYNEFNTLAEFMNISSTDAARAFLFHPIQEEEEEEEFTMDPSQAIPGSMDDLEVDVDLQEEEKEEENEEEKLVFDEEIIFDDEEVEKSKASKRKNVSFSAGTKPPARASKKRRSSNSSSRRDRSSRRR